MLSLCRSFCSSSIKSFTSRCLSTTPRNSILLRNKIKPVPATFPRYLATMSALPTDSSNMINTSGHTEPVWISTAPYRERPSFPQLTSDVTADLCIVGAGIAGIQTAYEAIQAGLSVILIDAREALSGETGRTSGHLSSAMDDRFYELIKTFGEDGARKAYESHQYAIDRIGEIAKKEGIDCEYRKLKSVMIVDVPETDPGYAKANDFPEEVEAYKKLGIEHNYVEHGKIGDKYTGAIFEHPNQAAFHPTK